MFGFGQAIGIDLGTATVLVYVKGKGIVLREPSVVAIDRNTGEALSVGEEARRMLGRTPGNIVAIRPLKDGVISDYSVTEKMLKYFIKKVCGKFVFSPTIMVCIPSGVTEVEKKAVIDAATQAGARKVYLIEEPIAAAIGAGLDISKACGSMVVDMGGGTTDIAVISLGGAVVSTSIKVAGDKFDEAIIKYIKKRHNVMIGERTAEELKLNIGCVEAVLSVLERTPPELSADISDRGIYMTGGGCLVYGFDKLIQEKTGINVMIAEESVSCVAIGTGRALDDEKMLEKLNAPRRVKY